MRIFTIILLAFFAQLLTAQTLRGRVQNQINGQPLANIQLVFSINEVAQQTTQSDESGFFRFDQLPIGTGLLTVNAEGFAPYALREMIIAAGKEQVVAVFLIEGEWESAISPVEIVEARPMRQVAPLGEIPLSRAQTLYNPMTYFDPARLATAYAGVAQTDDGTNSMSIRGNNPALVRWRLNGMDIISPNHLPNAGTQSDQPTSSSGGVMMLSAQMIDNASLITGAGLAGYNDGIGGIMDLHLRKGNNERHEQTIQAGLIGIDAAVEGPLSRRKRGSYLLNYRYSFVGLLGAMGVSFGGEKITFQDIAAHIYLPGKKRNAWSLYAIGGKSSNNFSPPDTATVFKELFAINFASRSAITGVQFTGYSGRNFYSQTGVSFSWQGNDRVQTLNSNTYASNLIEETKLVINSSNRYRINSSSTLLAGINLAATTFYNFERTTNDARDLIEGSVLTQLWLAGESTFRSGSIKVHYGINPVVSSYGNSLDPRIQAYWRASERHQWVLSTASYSQMLPLWYIAPRITLLRSTINAIRHNYTPSDNWLLSTELFYQQINNVSVNSGTGLSFINQNEFQYNIANSTKGTANNFGVEWSAQRRLNKGWFMNGNITLLRSVYTGLDDIQRRTRWDVGQIVNLTAGKEWGKKLKKQTSGRRFGVSGRTVYMGGYRSAPVDLVASQDASATVYDVTNGYTLRNKDYFRLDGRVYWKRSIGAKRNSTLAVEFQNLTARKNTAYNYYDPLTKVVTTKYQLGMIPNLSWRIEL